jgi:hypothetical protein
MVNTHSQAAFQFSLNKLDWNRLVPLFVWVLLLVGAAGAVSAQSADEQVTVVNGTYDGTAFGVGSSLRITGRVTKGAMSFGGDVIVEGVVEGDVATIGGSVIQKPGSRIGGDIIVVGGTYHADDATAQRRPEAMTMMFAGYQQELRNMMRNPTGLFSPDWTPTYFGTRLLVVLFWFLVSLGFTVAMPGTISRGVARLQLTSLRVAAIGLISIIVLYGFVILCLWIMPQPVRVLVTLLAIVLSLVVALFGRVILYAATGRWIQRKYAAFGKNSEAVALLLGTTFWVLLTSLPYVWPFMATFILIISFGLALTARYRAGFSH